MKNSKVLKILKLEAILSSEVQKGEKGEPLKNIY